MELCKKFLSFIVSSTVASKSNAIMRLVAVVFSWTKAVTQLLQPGLRQCYGDFQSIYRLL